jgi:hypothetical protein
VLAYGGKDIARGVGEGESPRECVKLLHFMFAPPGHFGLPPQTGREVPGNDCDEYKER